jgi:hypothetical protein
MAAKQREQRRRRRHDDEEGEEEDDDDDGRQTHQTRTFSLTHPHTPTNRHTGTHTQATRRIPASAARARWTRCAAGAPPSRAARRRRRGRAAASAGFGSARGCWAGPTSCPDLGCVCCWRWCAVVVAAAAVVVVVAVVAIACTLRTPNMHSTHATHAPAASRSASALPPPGARAQHRRRQ